MKVFALLALVFVLASARVSVRDVLYERTMVSGSNPGREPRSDPFPSDYVTGTPAGTDLQVVSHKVLKEPLIGQTITGHVLYIEGAGEHYHTYTHNDKCPGVAHTSTTAEEHGCQIATNAGFFGMQDHSCIGPIVSDGTIIHNPSRLGAVFGITNDGQFVAGYANESVIQSGAFKQLVQGRGWLVRDGQSYLDVAAEKENIAKSFIQLLAPRLAIGWDKDGRLILLVVDGVESKKKGIDLKTFTSLLINLGAVEAINLDGGGSVTFIWDGHFCESSGVGQEACSGNPTTDEVPYGKPYERPVTSITCFK